MELRRYLTGLNDLRCRPLSPVLQKSRSAQIHSHQTEQLNGEYSGKYNQFLHLTLIACQSFQSEIKFL
jgi:hypothetical protein